MHGSKKWIRDYRGRLKRSNNRTKLDFYAGLRAWNEDADGRYHRRGNKTPCPQCKHVRKAMQNDIAAYKAAKAAVHTEWVALYGHHYWVRVDGKNLFFQDYLKEHRLYPGYLWAYDDRNYYCYKHERMYEQKRQMWDANLNGTKENSRWTIKHGRQKYRRKVKHLMAQAKFDEDLYDDILPPRREWLD